MVVVSFIDQEMAPNQHDCSHETVISSCLTDRALFFVFVFFLNTYVCHVRVCHVHGCALHSRFKAIKHTQA